MKLSRIETPVVIMIGYTTAGEESHNRVVWWTKDTVIPTVPVVGMILMDEPTYSNDGGLNFKVKDIRIRENKVILYCGVIQNWDIRPSPEGVLMEYGYKRKPKN